MFSSLGLQPVNAIGVPTFVRGDSWTVIDLTVVSEDVIPLVTGWDVVEDVEAFSPHRMICFGLRRRLATSERWRRNQDGRTPYWWTAEIATARVTAVRSRRRVTRLRSAGVPQVLIDTAQRDYKTKKNTLKKEIRRTKRRCWRELLTSVDEDVFGQGYQIVSRALKAPPPRIQLSDGELREQVDALFPETPESVWRRPETVPAPPPPFTLEELEAAAGRMKTKKAPGSDGIPPEAVKMAVACERERLLWTFNALLESLTFPQEWKTASLVLIPKQVAPVRKYRPICLINILAKVYEQLVKARLEGELERGGGLSSSQHGFRRGSFNRDGGEEDCERGAQGFPQKTLCSGVRGCKERF